MKLNVCDSKYDNDSRTSVFLLALNSIRISEELQVYLKYLGAENDTCLKTYDTGVLWVVILWGKKKFLNPSQN